MNWSKFSDESEMQPKLSKSFPNAFHPAPHHNIAGVINYELNWTSGQDDSEKFS